MNNILRLCVTLLACASCTASATTIRTWSTNECRTALSLFVVERTAKDDCLMAIPKSDLTLFFRDFIEDCEQTPRTHFERPLEDLRFLFSRMYTGLCDEPAS